MALVSSHHEASVSVIESRIDNTCNANTLPTPSALPSSPTGFRTVCLGRVDLVFNHRNGKLVMVIDSGATSHMNPYRGAFIKYTPLPPGNYVELADKSKVPALGIGTTLQHLAGKLVTLTEVLHVPHLHSPLLSIRAFRQ
jgi:hypothetical protein